MAPRFWRRAGGCVVTMPQPASGHRMIKTGASPEQCGSVDTGHVTENQRQSAETANFVVGGLESPEG